MRITKKQLNKKLSSVYGEEDNEMCLDCIYSHGCHYCDFVNTCCIMGFEWIFNKYEVMPNGSLLIHDEEDEEEEDGNN